MSPLTLALIVLLCVFGSALFGMFLRPLLPEHHLSADSKEVTRIVTGLMATLAALVLELLVASGKTSFDTFNNGFRQNAAKVIVLDRVLAQYGQETKEFRDLIRNAYAARIEELFPRDKSERVSLDAAQETAGVEGIQQRLRRTQRPPAMPLIRRAGSSLELAAPPRTRPGLLPCCGTGCGAPPEASTPGRFTPS